MDEQSNESRKKLLVPLVALLLASVAVIGAGYALTATVSNDDNSIATETLTVDLYSDETAKTAIGKTLIDTSVKATTAITVDHTGTGTAATDYTRTKTWKISEVTDDTVNNSAATVTWSIDSTTGALTCTAVFYLKVVSSDSSDGANFTVMNASKFTVTNANVTWSYAAAGSAITYDDNNGMSVTNGQIVKVTATIAATGTSAMSVEATADDISFSAAPASS